MKNKILNLMIALLGILFAALTVFTVSEIYDAGRIYRCDADDFLSFARRQDYGDMLYHMYTNEAGGVYVSEEMKECYAIARYYEAATFYKAYLRCGSSEKAAEMKGIMEEQRALMGNLAYTAEEIDERLRTEN